MMFRPDYVTPASLEELLATLYQHGSEAKLIAGGTDLLPQMRLGRKRPQLLVDPRLLPLAGMTQSNGEVSLGARLTHTQVLHSAVLNTTFPALVTACRSVGGPPVRNRGTLVGNLANASPAADSALALMVYDAQVLAVSYAGERQIPLTGFYHGPGQTCLAPDEFIREVRLPQMPPRTLSVFLKLGNRQAMAIAVASVAVRLSLDGSGNVSQARIALGSVAPMPLRAFQAEALLQTGPLSDETILEAARAARAVASPLSDLRASASYRSKMVLVLTRRALHMACQEFARDVAHG
jgi:carbon-monoxide dehydrogenase medium subunit